MSMINKEISEFRTYAYHENDFKFVSKVLKSDPTLVYYDGKYLEKITKRKYNETNDKALCNEGLYL